jgi:hypothetical protein
MPAHGSTSRERRRNRLVAGVAAAGLCALFACNDAETPPPATPKPASGPQWPRGFSQVTAKCAQIASCAKPGDPPRLADPSACVDHWLARGSEDPQAKCLLAATSCNDVDACKRGGSDANATAFCASHPGVLSACDGARVVTCAGDDGREAGLVDCAAVGATCSETRLAGGLIVRGCASAKLCPPGAPEARCEGAAPSSAVITCHDGMVERVACGGGERCTQHDDEGEASATCAPATESRCNDVGGSRCDPSGKLLECVASGHFGGVRTTDCAKAGLVCRARGNKSACVVDAAPECARRPTRCEGDLLVYCAAGAEVKVSCASIHLGPCDPGARGPEAACGAPVVVPAKAPPT